jgi:hypothetical protein
MSKEQTPIEWLAQEISKLNVSMEAKLFIEKLKNKAEKMDKKRMETLKDFDTWKEWKNTDIIKSE